MEINLKITDENKANLILSLLKDLPYVEVTHVSNTEKILVSSVDGFETAKKKNLLTDDIRKKEWKR